MNRSEYIEDLKQRLRTTEQRERGGARWPVNPDGREAASVITELVVALRQIQTANNAFPEQASRTINQLIDEVLT